MRVTIVVAAAVFTLNGTVQGGVAVNDGGSVAVEGTQFVVTSVDGDVLRSHDLVGEVLRLDVEGEQLLVTIAAVGDGGGVVVHDLRADGQPLCMPDPEGRMLGFPVADDAGGWQLTCTSGAVGKCVLAGYRPWDSARMRDLHAACTRMFRADYAGDGETYTRDGTPIAWCDRDGVNPCGDGGAGEFEAAWGVDGATCVARPRFADIITLDELVERYDLAECSEATAFDDPDALLLNRSAIAARAPWRLLAAAAMLLLFGVARLTNARPSRPCRTRDAGGENVDGSNLRRSPPQPEASRCLRASIPFAHGPARTLSAACALRRAARDVAELRSWASGAGGRRGRRGQDGAGALPV